MQRTRRLSPASLTLRSTLGRLERRSPHAPCRRHSRGSSLQACPRKATPTPSWTTLRPPSPPNTRSLITSSLRGHPKTMPPQCPRESVASRPPLILGPTPHAGPQGTLQKIPHHQT